MYNMRLIKLAFISIIVLFAIVTAMSLAIPSQVRISRAVNLKAGKNEVFPLISNLTDWPLWHPAFKDQNINQTLAQNNITLTPLAVTDTLVTVQWQQQGRRPVLNGWQMHTIAGADSTALQWYMDFSLPWYPWHKFGSLFYEKTYGVLMEQGLENLKAQVQEEQLQNN